MASGIDSRVGSYRLVRRLGVGGMGEVWLGEHVLTGGVAAVKVLREGPRRALYRELFAREGRIITRLSHPHIVRVFDVGEDFLVCAFVDGADLQRRLRTPIQPGAAVAIVLQVASALAHAHAAGVVHSDVKPANILLDRNGTAFLSDFGLAQVAGEAMTIAGTPAFMPPEQADGVVSPQADQWSLARTLLVALAGAHDGDVDAALGRLPRDLPPAVRDVLACALDRNPARRFAGIERFAEALAAIDLGRHAAPSRRARECRVAAPFAWAAQPRKVARLGPVIQRADHSIAELARAGAIDAAAAGAFLARTGLADVGFAIYGRADRLGPLDSPSAFARAGEIVVLLHGWLQEREVWQEMAAAIVRDNAEAIVLTPDVLGCGESRFAARRPRREQTTPRATAEMVLAWLELLGLRELPGVLVGHSMSGLAVLTLTDEELGERLQRVALTPAIVEVSRFALLVSWIGVALLAVAGLHPAIHRALIGLFTIAAAALSEEWKTRMRQTASRVPPPVLARLLAGAARQRLPPRTLRGAILCRGATDPNFPEWMATRAIARFGGAQPATHVLASGGHFPHMAEAAHPEWTARNQDELVRIVDAALLASQSGRMASTTVSPRSG